ncbi:MAG: exopolygalacturonase [Bacteroidaceae bacterium]|nr:exopolygalacturonase [Bacteroidaceae bacterium]
MKNTLLKFCAVCAAVLVCASADGRAPRKHRVVDLWPDGTPISAWFSDTAHVDITTLGRQYVLTDYGVQRDSTLLQTEAIQAVIDRAAREGGGVVVVPEGTFLSGSLFFRQGTHLHLREGAVLKGSDFIGDFALMDTRLEGQNIHYFMALVNAIGLDGFTISGTGTLNGNGERYWRSFWLRRQYNRQCTNLEEMRPRLVFLQDCRNVTLCDAHFLNSPFWTCHLYRCENVKALGLYTHAPSKGPVKAPSCDAFDVDVCTNVLIHGCYMDVNDDAVALKGGKGPYADKDTIGNGPNRNILIENCSYGFCHGALTCGSESLLNHNVILRRCHVEGADRILWLKMRPDTPQRYEYIRVEDITGSATRIVFVHPWTQFFDLKGRADIPYSTSAHITLRNLNMTCRTFLDMEDNPDQYTVEPLHIENCIINGNPVSSE